MRQNIISQPLLLNLGQADFTEVTRQGSLRY